MTLKNTTIIDSLGFDMNTNDWPKVKERILITSHIIKNPSL